MDIKTLQETIVPNLIDKAQEFLCVDGFVHPILFVIAGEQMTLVRIKEDEIDIDDLLSDIVKKPEVESLILMTQAKNSVVTSTDSVTRNSLLFFLYAKDKTYIKEVCYERAGKLFSFSDKEWKEASNVEGLYANPFLTVDF